MSWNFLHDGASRMRSNHTRSASGLVSMEMGRMGQSAASKPDGKLVVRLMRIQPQVAPPPRWTTAAPRLYFAPMRRLHDHAMLLVLALLCVLFSVITIEEQPATSPAAAKALADAVVKRFGPGAHVLVAARSQPEDQAFASALAAALTEKGANVAQTVTGEPRDALQALRQLAEKNQALDAIACSAAASEWLVFADAATDFPALGKPVIMPPQSTRWPTFLTTQNLMNVANQIAVIAIIAIGMTLVIIGGGIDLSVGSLIALAAVVCSVFVRDHLGGKDAGTWGMIAAACAAISVCALAGLVSGTVITAFSLPPFIVTLAMMMVASGLSYRIADGQSIDQVPETFIWLGRGADFAGVPNAVVLMLALYALAHLLMRHTAFGRHLHAVGGNRDAALVSGLRVKRVTLFSCIISGALAGLGGVVMASNLKSGSPTYGQMYELYVIAAVVVGGASLSGGQGKMFGTLVGALILGVIQNGMNLANITSYDQRIVLGVVILVAVLLDRVKRRGI